MRFSLLLIPAGLVAAGHFVLAGCGESFDDNCLTYRNCSGDSGGDGGVDAPGGGTLYVSKSTGDDGNGNSGTDPQKPLKTIAAALAKRPDKVNVCKGQYDESLTISSAVQLVGGLDCSSWTAAAGNDVSVQPTTGADIALSIQNANGVTVSDMSFTGAGSVSGLFANSTVKLTRTAFISRNAGDGLDQPADGGAFVPSAAPNGNPGTGTGGGGVQPNPNCTSQGGAGGDLGSSPTSGKPGGDGTPKYGDASVPLGSNGAGGTVTGSGCGDGQGKNGSHGGGGAFGTSATTYGVLTASGFTPSAGGNGSPGQVGQGGGGGASEDSSGGGGGGGAGGCPGTSGQGGAGGGASIGLALYQSTVDIDSASTFAAGDAGKGGNGGAGQVAQGSGKGGIVQIAGECQGGGGGAGGSGGGGGGGAGGISVGILWFGTPPNIDGQAVQNAQTKTGFTFSSKVAQGGAPGQGGAAVIPTGVNASKPGGTDSHPGTTGISQAILQLTP